MYTACGRFSISSHCVQSSIMSPSALKTTIVCSHRASTPIRPRQACAGSSGSAPGAPAPGGLDAGPCEALRNGTWPTGKERLGPISGTARPAGRSIAGSSPRCTMKTRSGLSAKTPCDEPHVQFSCPGRLDNGFGQSATTSYGPVRSTPPLSDGTAANPAAGGACSCTAPGSPAPPHPVANAAANASVTPVSSTALVRIDVLSSR